MECPPSLNGYIEQTGLPEGEAQVAWEGLLMAWQTFVKTGVEPDENSNL